MSFGQQSPLSKLKGKIVDEVWLGKEVDYSILRIFKCPAYAHIDSIERLKLDDKSNK